MFDEMITSSFQVSNGFCPTELSSDAWIAWIWNGSVYLFVYMYLTWGRERNALEWNAMTCGMQRTAMEWIEIERNRIECNGTAEYNGI